MIVNRYIGFSLIGFCLFNFFYLIPGQIQEESLGMVGPSFFPQYITIFLAILGGLLAATTFGKKAREKQAAAVNTPYRKNTFLVMLLSFVYVAGIYYLGYVVPSVLALIFMMRLYGEKISLKLSLVSVVVVFAIFIFFARVMNLMMPKGLLSPIFDALIY